AAETVGRNGSAAVIGAGVNGEAVVRTFVARGRDVLLYDLDPTRAEDVAARTGATVAPSRDDALAADVGGTVTPSHRVVFTGGSLRAGQHVSLMGADGPGKQEIAVEEVARVHVFCDDWEQGETNGIRPRGRIYADDWEQASHNGDLVHAVQAGVLSRED